ncbi:MAG: trigger factor [Patescibacteria group bacterium]
MHYELKTLEKSQVEFEITVEPAGYKKDLESAAVRISERAAIKGFRPGKAPYDMVKQQVGEVRIIEEAMQSIVEKNFYNAVKQEKLETVGMPQITIQKVAPGNDFVFKAVVALMPKVKLGEIEKIKVERKTKEVGAKEVDDVLENLKKMQTKEVAKSGPATKADKVTINMEMFINKVPIEGGQAKDHQVYLSENHYIPGLQEKLIGLQKDETKEFSLKFPKEHYQKHLADKDVDFKIKINEVFELQYPELNDEFAKSLGQNDLCAMKELLKTNLAEDAKTKEEQRLEIEIFDKLIEKSEFGEIPDVLIKTEKNKIFHELKHNLSKHGIEMEQYLKDLKKTEEQIFNDFTEQAEKRVKAALVSRQIALENKITAEQTDIDKEIKSIRAAYPDDKIVEENLKKPEVIDTLAVTIQNRKVIELLKSKILK